MTELKGGDRVRVVGNKNYLGRIGEVELVTGSKIWDTMVWVWLGEDNEPVRFYAYELELVDEEPLTAEPILTPDPVEHPAHYYHPSGVEVIDIVKHESFLRGNIIKYVMRAPYKGNELEDLRKAAQYLAWEIERVEAEGE